MVFIEPLVYITMAASQKALQGYVVTYTALILL